MFHSSATTRFFGGDTSEVMPGCITVLAVNPATELYLAREAMWRQVSADLDSIFGVLGQPTRAALGVRRGDLLFADGTATGAGDHPLMGSSAPVVFSSLLGLPFQLKLGAIEYRFAHNGVLTQAYGRPAGAPLGHLEAHRRLNDMLRQRYDDLHFVGVAMSDWVIDDQRQSNAGIAAVASGTIAIVNTTGHSVSSGTLLSLKMPQWGDQFGWPSQPDGSQFGYGAQYNQYPNNSSTDLDTDPAAAARSLVCRPRLQVHTTETASLYGVAGNRERVLDRIRDVLQAVRWGVQEAGHIFGRQMDRVRIEVRDRMLAPLAVNSPPAARVAQDAIDSRRGGAVAFQLFMDQWALVNAQVDLLAANPARMSASDLHDAYLCVLVELMRIHTAIWGVATGPPAIDAFFDNHHYTERDQEARRFLLGIRALYTVPGGTFFRTTGAANFDTLAATAAAERAVTANVLATVRHTKLRDLATRVVAEMINLHAALTALDAAVTAAGANIAADQATQVEVNAISLRLGILCNRLRATITDFTGGAEPAVSATTILAAANSMRTAAHDIQTAAANVVDFANVAGLMVALGGVNLYDAELGGINARQVIAENASSFDVAVVAMDMMRTTRTNENTDRIKVDLPDDTEQDARNVVDPNLDAKQIAIIDARYTVDIDALRDALLEPNRSLYRRELDRIEQLDMDALTALIRPWDDQLKTTFVRVRGLILALGLPYTDTSHYHLIFKQPVDVIGFATPERRRLVQARTLPLLDLAGDLTLDPLLSTWVSLAASTRAFATDIRGTDAGTIGIRSSIDIVRDLILNPTEAAVAAAIKDSVHLYMAYNSSIINSASVPGARFGDHFVMWGGRAGLQSPQGNPAGTKLTPKWHERAMFKVVEGSEPGGLVRVTILG